MADPVILPSLTQVADSVMVGNPTMLQDPYRAVQDRYPMTPMPPRYTVPIEEEIATNDLVSKMQARDIQMRGMLLNQKINSQQFDYETNVQRQTQEALEANILSKLAPGDANYEAQKAAIVQQYPLAAQNPAFQRLFEGPDDAHRRAMQTSEVLKRDGFEQDARDRYAEDRQEQTILMDLAKYGPDAIAAYQSNLKPDQTGFITPEAKLQAYAAAQVVVQKAQQQSLQDRPMTPQQVRNEKLDIIRQMNTMMARKTGTDTKDSWTPEQDQMLQFLQSELNSLNSNPSNTGTPPKTAPPKSFFPKPSTKTGP